MRATSCPKGTYASGTATVCDLCGIGKFNDLTEQTSESSCKSCETGKYFDPTLTGQISVDYCKTCELGKEPTGDQFACVLIGEQAEIYFERTSGFCTDGGGSLIGTKGDCEEFARVQGWSDKTAETVTSSYSPRGCWQSGRTFFNTKASSTKPCSSSEFTCACKLICQAGTYQDQTGQTTCKPCATGQYQNQVAKTIVVLDPTLLLIKQHVRVAM